MYRRHSASTSYRIGETQITALIKAHERVVRERLDEKETQALERRARSLHTMQLYDRVVVAAKAGRYGRAAEIAIRAPASLALADAASARASPKNGGASW